MRLSRESRHSRKRENPPLINIESIVLLNSQHAVSLVFLSYFAPFTSPIFLLSTVDTYFNILNVCSTVVLA